MYGNQNYRGACPSETVEQVSFFNWLRREHPEYGAIALHIRNEGKRSFHQAAKEKAEGMTAGACDIVIPGNPSFCCEMKRQDYTKSRWQECQEDYLYLCHLNGAFTCVALGYEGAKQAFLDWRDECLRTR